MALITFIEHDGTEHQIEVEAGYSVMQAALDNMLEAIVAECGGACSCATCHCYVDESWADKIGEPETIETDMIDFAVNRKDNSRLSCQLIMSDELDGLVIHLPESQY